jgi:hypothetical protein
MKTLIILAIMTSMVCAQIMGKWKNELDSVMTVDHIVGDTFHGIYETAVSGNGTHLTAPVDGKFTMPTAPETLGTIAFAVNWEYKNSEGKIVRSTSTWAGFYTDSVISAQWLLVRGCTLKDTWSSTTVGKDFFNKQK